MFGIIRRVAESTQLKYVGRSTLKKIETFIGVWFIRSPMNASNNIPSSYPVADEATIELEAYDQKMDYFHQKLASFYTGTNNNSSTLSVRNLSIHNNNKYLSICEEINAYFSELARRECLLLSKTFRYNSLYYRTNRDAPHVDITCVSEAWRDNFKGQRSEQYPDLMWNDPHNATNTEHTFATPQLAERPDDDGTWVLIKDIPIYVSIASNGLFYD